MNRPMVNGDGKAYVCGECEQDGRLGYLILYRVGPGYPTTSCSKHGVKSAIEWNPDTIPRIPVCHSDFVDVGEAMHRAD